MGKSGKLGSILLAWNGLLVNSLSYTVDLKSIITLRGHEQLSLVIKVKRKDGGWDMVVLSLEELRNVSYAASN